MLAVPMKTFWRITKLLADYPWLVFVGFSTALLQTLATLTIPWLTRGVINKAIVPGKTSLLVWYGLALLGIGALRFGFAVARRLSTGKISLDIEFELRNRMWAHLLRQPFGYFDRWPTGQLMSRAMADIQNVRMFLGYGLIFFTTNIFSMVAVTVLMFVLNWQLALISLAFLPLLLLVTVRFSRRLQPILRDVQQKIADVTETAEENVTGSRIVRIFAREDDELAKFSDRSTRVFEAEVSAARIRALYIPLIGFLPNLAIVVLLYVGGRQVIDHTLSLGSLVAFYSYLILLIYPAQVIGWLTGLAQRAIASGHRVYEILDAPIEMTERPDATALPGVRGEVRFEGVSFSYVDRPVLEQIDLEVPAGRTIALVGHTGCGKTTLTNLVPRFYDAGAGRVLIDGHDVRDVRLADLRGHIGVVTQDPFLFSTTIADNIRLGRPDASDEQVREAAERAQAASFIEALPEGYETVVGDRGLTLSGGQRQRIAIARALVVDPQILILDDATSSVDSETEFKIRRALVEVMKGRTTFIIAHRPSTISLAEEIVVLAGGRIVERGVHRDLIAADTLYRRMFGAAELEGTTLDDAEVVGGGGPADVRRPASADRRRGVSPARPEEVS
ncbi:MAG TPA: ABC transporter ATP-binding protein [Thermoleophilia bacterium]|nr:ABC transporter ATP-binding protein [Thermoleophilia bacterium]